VAGLGQKQPFMPPNPAAVKRILSLFVANSYITYTFPLTYYYFFMR